MSAPHAPYCWTCRQPTRLVQSNAPSRHGAIWLHITPPDDQHDPTTPNGYEQEPLDG